jgi:hypothetical protein
MILHMDGCQGGDLASKYSAGSSATRSTSAPRFTGGAHYESGILYRQCTAVSEIFMAGAFKWAGISTSAASLSVYGDSGATQHLSVLRNASGLLELRRGGTGGTLLATGTTVIPTSAWAHLQLRATIADSGGIAQVRLNGASAPEIDFTGDTKNGGTNSTIDRVAWASTSSGYGITDTVLLTTAGSVNNSWPGDCRVQTLIPSGNGNSSQGVGSDADSVNNYLLVDESPFSTTDYVGVTTDGNGDTYALSDLDSGTSTVKAVQVNLHAAKSDAGAKSIKRRVRSGATTYAGSAVVLSTSYATVTEILETDPATSTAWTPSGVNALEAGFEAAT